MNKILRYSLLAVLAIVAHLSFAQTEFDFDTNGVALLGVTGESSNESTAGDITEAKTATIGDISVTVSSAAEGASTPNRLWSSAAKLRMYSGTLTISSKGDNIKSIVITAKKWNTGNTASVGTLDNSTWTGDAKEVVINIAGNTQINKITVSCKSSEDPDPDTPEGLKGAGTLDNPYTVADALIVTGKLASGEKSTDKYYIKGKIASIKYTFSAQYGTATFNISDDGTESNMFTCYSVFYLENKSWIEGYTQVAVGDDVIIYGTVTNYNGTLETANKNAYVYSLNGKTKAEDTPDPDEPTIEEVTVAKALELINALADGAKSDKEYKVKGYIVGTPDFQRNGDNVLYGNVNTTIADEKGGTTTLTIFRAKSFNNEKFTEDTISLLKEDDLVVFQGTLQKYVNNETVTPELTTGYLFSVNGQTASVSTIKADANADAPAYNLAGQKVTDSYKGLVIKNGKKYMK